MPDDSAPTDEELAQFTIEDVAARVALGMRHPDYRADRVRWIEALRARASVLRDARYNTGLLTSLADADALLRDRSASSDPRKAAPGAPSRKVFRDREGKTPPMLVLDEPEHRRLRRLVAYAFTPRAVEAVRPRVAAIAGELLDHLADRETFDLIDDYCTPLPSRVIAEMLGVDASDWTSFRDWSRDFVALFHMRPTPAQERRIQQAGAALEAYFARAIEARRTSLGDDLISALIRAEDAGDRLASDEIVTMCMLLLLAGNLTTTDLIGNGVVALLQHPAQLARLRAEPGMIANAVEEVLRYDAPVETVARTLMEPRTIGGCPFAAGDYVMASLVAGARDPAVAADPHGFDITRREPQHLAFGAGIHACIGAPLARLEAEVAILSLVQRFPDLRLSGAPLRRRPIPSFCGYESVLVHVR